MAYRILVADDLAEDGLAILRNVGEVTVRKGMDEAALRAALSGQHALVVRSATQVTARSLELADELAVIGRAGIGVDNIDVAAATARGIVVMKHARSRRRHHRRARARAAARAGAPDPRRRRVGACRQVGEEPLHRRRAA